MTARELWEYLDGLRQENPAAFETREVYVEIIDRASYEQEQRINGIEDYDQAYADVVLGEGQAFGVVEPTDYDLTTDPHTELETYILIRAVELEDDEND
jgi:hypothetical protein